MKNLLTAFAFLFVITACSSGSTVSETPASLGGAAFVGTFVNESGNDDGDITLSLSQDANATEVTGLASITGSSCLVSGVVSGTVTGFNATLTVEQDSGTLTFALTQSGSMLSGSYALTGSDSCSAGTGTGTATLSR